MPLETPIYGHLQHINAHTSGCVLKNHAADYLIFAVYETHVPVIHFAVNHFIYDLCLITRGTHASTVVPSPTAADISASPPTARARVCILASP